MLICNNINDPGFRIRRYYGGPPANNGTTIQNSDYSPLYFTQPIGIGGPVTTNMELEVIGNTIVVLLFLLKIYHVLMHCLIQYGLEIWL